MALFAESSHRHWLFTEEELAAVRSKCRQSALRALLAKDRTPRFFACKGAASDEEGCGGSVCMCVLFWGDLLGSPSKIIGQG